MIGPKSPRAAFEIRARNDIVHPHQPCQPTMKKQSREATVAQAAP